MGKVSAFRVSATAFFRSGDFASAVAEKATNGGGEKLWLGSGGERWFSVFSGFIWWRTLLVVSV